MILRRRALILAGLAGCARPAPPFGDVPVAPSVTLRLPEPADLGRTIEAAQMVRATYQGRDIVFEGQVSVTAKRLKLACLDPLGRPALMLQWGQGRIDVRTGAWFPAGLRPENMLADIMLIYWPAPSLRRGLGGSGADVVDGPETRLIRNGSQPVIRICYNSNDPWNGTASYASVVWGYTLQVQSVEVAS